MPLADPNSDVPSIGYPRHTPYPRGSHTEIGGTVVHRDVQYRNRHFDALGWQVMPCCVISLEGRLQEGIACVLMPHLRITSRLRKGRSQIMEGDIISQYHVVHQDLHHPWIGEEFRVGELAGKDNIQAQVINHMHVDVPVSVPPGSTDPARVDGVDGVDVVSEVAEVCRQEFFIEDVLQHQLIWD